MLWQLMIKHERKQKRRNKFEIFFSIKNRKKYILMYEELDFPKNLFFGPLLKIQNLYNFRFEFNKG